MTTTTIRPARPRWSALLAALIAVGVTLVAAPAAAAQPLEHNHGPQTVEPRDTNCANSDLDLHDGFQEAPACVQTNFGEVAVQNRNPSVLIVDIPRRVRSGESFAITVSSRNLSRTRFLAAGQGGYYAEGAQLNAEGITEGHAHVACRVLPARNVAPDPDPVPAFFQAVEDDRGGVAPDTFTVNVPGRNAQNAATFPPGADVQCSVWAGDGSHRTPMMQRANQTPAFDVARVEVRGQGGNDGDRDRRRGRDRDD